MADPDRRRPRWAPRCVRRAVLPSSERRSSRRHRQGSRTRADPDPIGKADRWHLQYARRWVVQYNFYLHDAEWGRMFVRLCPYFPFSARVCLNQHQWLATRIRAEGLRFRQASNAFLTCSDPARLQALADSLTARDIDRGAQKWLRAFTPFFTPTERRTAGCQHRLFFAQVEYADNLIFDRRAALDALGDRLHIAFDPRWTP